MEVISSKNKSYFERKDNKVLTPSIGSGIFISVIHLYFKHMVYTWYLTIPMNYAGNNKSNNDISELILDFHVDLFIYFLKCIIFIIFKLK